MFGLFEHNLTPSTVISYTSIAFDIKWIIPNKERLFRRRNKLRNLCFFFSFPSRHVTVKIEQSMDVIFPFQLLLVEFLKGVPSL